MGFGRRTLATSFNFGARHCAYGAISAKACNCTNSRTTFVLSHHSGDLIRRSTGGYRAEIDGLRAVAVIAVIANHFNHLLPGGFLGVDVFFVISGYVITSSMEVDQSQTATGFLINFYSRRIKRLLPALVVCIAAAALVGTIVISAKWDEYTSSMRVGRYALLGFANMALYSSATDYFSQSADLNLFTHTWSLSVEEQFYLIFPALYWFGMRRDFHASARKQFAVILGMVGITSWLMSVWLLQKGFEPAYFLTAPRLWELGLGCAARLYGKKLSRQSDQAHPNSTSIAGMIVVLAFVTDPKWQVISTPAVVMATALLIVLLRPRTVMYSILTSKPAVSIGVVSYSLYLWHWVVIVLARWTITTADWSVPLQIAFVPLQIALMTSLAYATYLWIERPLRNAQWSPRGWITIGYGFLTAMLGIGFIQLLTQPLNEMLYVGRSVNPAQIGTASLSQDRFQGNHIIWPASECVLTANQDVNKVISLQRCTFGVNSASGRHFFVIGNSFSAAEFEMYSVLVERGLGSVTATSTWGASPVPEVVNTSFRSKVNDYYWSVVVSKLMNAMRSGDIVIMLNDLSSLMPMTTDNEEVVKENRRLLEVGLVRLSKDLARRGIAVIFQAGSPLLRDAHCSPNEWQHHLLNLNGGESCRFYTRADTLARRRPLDELLERVRADNRNFTVVDLFPVLCPSEVCGMTNEERVFLYRDAESHPSVEANKLARGVFLDAVATAMQYAAVHGSR